MDGESSQQQAGADPCPRHRLARILHRQHRVDADEPQRVVGEVRRDEHEQHEAAHEAQALPDVAARENVHCLPCPKESRAA
jgi:hypothetical protein